MQNCLQNAHKGGPAPEGVAPEVQGARPTEGNTTCSMSEAGSRGSRHSGQFTEAGPNGDHSHCDSPGSVVDDGARSQAGGSAGPIAGSLAGQERGSCSRHKTGLRHTDQLLSDPSSSGDQHQSMSVSDQDDSDTDGAAAQQTKVTGIDHWAAAFTSKNGRQQQGAGPQAAAQQGRGVSSSGQVPAKQRGFTSWIGDFGHLDGPRFSKQQGRAWQAHMRSQRDQPDAQSEYEDDPEPTLQVCKAVLDITFEQCRQYMHEQHMHSPANILYEFSWRTERVWRTERFMHANTGSACYFLDILDLRHMLFVP